MSVPVLPTAPLPPRALSGATRAQPAAPHDPIWGPTVRSAAPSPWGPLWDQTRHAHPETQIWAGWSGDRDERTAQILRYLEQGGSRNDWVVCPNAVPASSEFASSAAAQAQVDSARLPSGSPPALRRPTSAEERSPDVQALPLFLGLLVWSAWDDFQGEFGDDSPGARCRRQASVSALCPVFASASWWPPVWRRALAAHVPPEWAALAAVPISRVLWNDRYRDRPDRHTPTIDRLIRSSAVRPMSDGYIEGPLMDWFTSLAQASRNRGLGLPDIPSDQRPYASFWLRVHPDLWLARSHGAVLSSWMRGVDELARPSVAGDLPSVPAVVALLEERDLLRGAVRLTSRSVGSRPVVPFVPTQANRLDGRARPSRNKAPVDFLVHDLMRRLGSRGARSLPLTSFTNLMDEWVHLSDTPALLESIRCGWCPTNPQMHTMLRGLWAAATPPVPGSAGRVLPDAMTRAWWGQRASFLPLSWSDNDVLLSSAANANYTGPSLRAQHNPDWDGSGDVLRWEAPTRILLRALRVQGDQGKISWPNTRSGVAYQSWFDVRDDRVLLERRIRLADGLPAESEASHAPRRFRRF